MTSRWTATYTEIGKDVRAAARPRVLYFDMNVWIDMTRGCAQEDPAWQQIRDRLVSAVRRDQIIVPLSAAHYLELWHRRDAASRRQVAGLMRERATSRSLRHMSSANERLRPWCRPGITQGPRCPRRPISSDAVPLTRFGRPDGRFRFVDSIASSDGKTPEGPAAKPPDGRVRLRCSSWCSSSRVLLVISHHVRPSAMSSGQFKAQSMHLH